MSRTRTINSAMRMIPASSPASTSRPTSGSRQRPDSNRVQEMSAVGQHATDVRFEAHVHQPGERAPDESPANHAEQERHLFKRDRNVMRAKNR